MGVPAFFRWLSKKYPSIVVHCYEEKVKVIDGVRIPVDSSKPNPNNVEFDNLYLDMNGIIHPCCHPENKPAPKNEDEMMVAIFEYIDRIFSIVRPRRLLYMAIDGVAPRAKMNQQRSRRFRASKEGIEKVLELERLRSELTTRGCDLPPEKTKEEHFDSNCITPGTPFMDRLAKCLHYYIHDRLNNDPGWRDIEVILSDANVPGEGEHKIMDFIRRQRSNPDHDANTRHCLCGADADLIMLGLATHEPNFTIIREEFKPNQPRPCELCGQYGHEMKDCCGLAKEKQGEFDELEKPMESDVEFIFIRLNVLREYLAKELVMPSLPFEYDFERAVDDWVFMCFFVGNDFLPHLPSLEIREGAIDRLVNLYKNAVYKTGGFVTDSGRVNLNRVQLIMSELGEVEDEIFKRRQDNELAFRRRQKDRKKRMRMNDRPAWTPGGQFSPQTISSTPSPVQNARHEAYEMRMKGTSPKEALAAMMKPSGEGNSKEKNDESKGEKRRHEDDESDEEEPADDVRLWEDGWKDRYYEVKFEVAKDNIAFRHKVAAAYVEGLCWVLAYYYQGCATWKWFFPYHYAPFASDFVNLGDVEINFEKATEPFKPLEQLMGVFPAASRKHVPEPWGKLMTDPKSSIIDFYPTDFKVDLNGKKYAWQGVALLPFVDEKRLLKALESVYPLLTNEEKRRNVRGNDRLYVRKGHMGYDYLLGLYESTRNEVMEVDLDTKLFSGMAGKVKLAIDVIKPNETICSPVIALPDVPKNNAVCISYIDPRYPDDFIFPAVRLDRAEDPPKVLKPTDVPIFDRNWRAQAGMAPARQRAYLDIPGHRMLNHSMDIQSRGYSEVPPPSFGRSGNRRMGRDGTYPPQPYGYESHQSNFSRSGGRGGGSQSFDGRGSWYQQRTQQSYYSAQQYEQKGPNTRPVMGTGQLTNYESYRPDRGGNSGWSSSSGYGGGNGGSGGYDRGGRGDYGRRDDRSYGSRRDDYQSRGYDNGGSRGGYGARGGWAAPAYNPPPSRTENWSNDYSRGSSDSRRNPNGDRYRQAGRGGNPVPGYSSYSSSGCY